MKVLYGEFSIRDASCGRLGNLRGGLSAPFFFHKTALSGQRQAPPVKRKKADMTQNPAHAAITALALPLVEAAGLELWGIELLGEFRPVLRVYVEAAGGVTIEQCAVLSRQLGLALDVEDVITSAYTLEVSSPGLSRPFFSPEQLKAHVGGFLDVTLHEPMPDFPRRKKFYGRLEEVSGDIFALRLDDAPEGGDPAADVTLARISWDNVRRAHLVHIFPQKSKGAPKKAVAPRIPKLEEKH